jgi:hypothetical protein
METGRVFAYHGSSTGPEATAGWTAAGEQAGSSFGVSVATAGDVNADGYADVIVGAYRYDDGGADEGRAFVYHGSVAGLEPAPSWSADSDQAGAQFGYSVSTAGDVNGDGYDDVIVGAYLHDNGQEDEGRAFVYHGSPAGLAPSPDWIVESNGTGFLLGISVATAGDVDGDGYADVIVGAAAHANGEALEGGAFVYGGSASGLTPNPIWKAEGNQVGARLGAAVAPAGDVDGDGYADVIVGAWTYDNAPIHRDEGRAFVYHGSATGLATSHDWTAGGSQGGAFFGYSVGTAGDVNGDGYADVVVGAFGYDNGESDEGRVFVYHGSATGLATTPAWTAESDQAGASFGYSVGSGSFNGDGYADLIVGAISYDNDQVNEGRAFAYHGSAAGLATSPAWTAESDRPGSLYGLSVASAGSVDGDGYADVVVGAHAHASGRVYVYHGNGGRGLSLAPRQRRASDSGPLARLGMSDSPDGFRLAMLGRSPFGRGRVRMEWQVAPLGTSLAAGATQRAEAWTDTGTSGAELNDLVSVPEDATPYHWRVRLLHDPATAPYAPHGRWVTMPWKGWEETMLRTLAATAAAHVPDGATDEPLLLSRAGGEEITLTWSRSCLTTDDDYAIYEGETGDFTTHTARFCTTLGATTMTFAPLTVEGPSPVDTYYLVVPQSADREGSYGTDSMGNERPQGHDACLPRQIAECP